LSSTSFLAGMTACSMHIKTIRVTSQNYWLPHPLCHNLSHVWCPPPPVRMWRHLWTTPVVRAYACYVVVRWSCSHHFLWVSFI